MGRPTVLHGVRWLQGDVQLLHVPDDPGPSTGYGPKGTAGGKMRVPGPSRESTVQVLVREYYAGHRGASRTAIPSSTG